MTRLQGNWYQTPEEIRAAYTIRKPMRIRKARLPSYEPPPGVGVASRPSLVELDIPLGPLGQAHLVLHHYADEQEWQADCRTVPLHLYTDGSHADGVAGCGWVLLREASVLLAGRAHLGHQRSSHEAEVLGAILGLNQLPEGCQVHLHADSKALLNAIECWQEGLPALRMSETGKALEAACRRHQVRTTWVSAHKGVPMNCWADRLAARARLGKDEDSRMRRGEKLA